MKNIIIKACAVLIALLVVLTVILGTFSPDLINYYDTYGKMILDHPFKTILYDRPIWEYYSKTPSWFSPEGDFEYSFFCDFYFDSFNIARATFLSNKNSRNYSSYRFHVNDWVRKTFFTENRKVSLSRSESRSIYRITKSGKEETYTSFWSEAELMLSYYGAEYEEGKEYLIIYHSNRSYRKLGIPYYFAPLDGEYPYIEVYPDGTRYDATYFGAESKYVDKEEFVRLITEAINNPPAR